MKVFRFYLEISWGSGVRWIAAENKESAEIINDSNKDYGSQGTWVYNGEIEGLSFQSEPGIIEEWVHVE